LLQEIKEKQGLGLREQLILAQLYLRADEWPKCRTQMLETLGKHGSNQTVLSMYCRMLLDKKLIDQTQRWAGKLIEVDPTGDATMQIRAGLLVAQGKPDQATELLTGLLPSPIAHQDLRKLVTIATWLEQLELIPPAEKLLRRFVELEPRGELALAQFLGRHGDVEEAFEILLKNVNQQNRISVIQAAISTVRDRRTEIGNRYDKQIESWLDLAARDPALQRSALLQRASLRDVQGRHEDEEQLYRQLLARNDLTTAQRTLALNNLAFSLAMRNRAASGGMRLVKDAIEINGPTGALLDTRAMVSLSLGETERAISDLNLAISDIPKPSRYFHLALAQLAAGDKKSARISYLEAQRRGLKPEDVSQLERRMLENLLREIGLAQSRQAG
jgi:tetratricopeptide (TPR) repeat protein